MPHIPINTTENTKKKKWGEFQLKRQSHAVKIKLTLLLGFILTSNINYI